VLLDWRRKHPQLLGAALAQFALLAFGIISGTISGRLLGPQGRGELAAIMLWPTAFVFLASLGLNQAIVFHTGKRRYSISEVWSTACAIGLVQSLVVAAIGFALMPVLLRHYSTHVQRLGIMFLIATPVLLFSGYPGSVLLGQRNMRRFNVIRLIAPGCYSLALLALLVARQASLQAVVVSQIVGYVVALGAGVAILYHRENLAFTLRAETGRELLSYGVKNHFASLTAYFNQRIDQLMLSLLVPASELGLYAVAVTLATSVSFFPAAAGLVTFSRGSSQSDSETRHTISRSFRASLIWLLLCCGVLFFATPILIAVLLGPRFYGSVLACRLLLPGMVALGLNQVLYSGANAMGKPGLPSYPEGIAMGATALGLFLLVPRYGYIGAAIVSSVAYTVSLGLMLVLCATKMKLGLRDLLFTSHDASNQPEVA
jgi:O-antigen/teichoic acid export membrane protein